MVKKSDFYNSLNNKQKEQFKKIYIDELDEDYEYVVEEWIKEIDN